MHSAANVILFGMEPASTAREVEGVLQPIWRRSTGRHHAYSLHRTCRRLDMFEVDSLNNSMFLTCSLPELDTPYRTLACLMTGSGGTFIRAGRLKVNEFPDAFPDALRT